MSKNRNNKKIIPIKSYNKSKKQGIKKLSKEDRKNQIILISSIIIAIVIGIILVIRPNAYQVTADDVVIGIVKGEQVPEKSLDTVVASLKEKYKTDVRVASKIDLKKVHASKRKLVTPEYLISQMKENIDYEIKMIDLIIDGKSYGIFPTEEEANIVLDKIKDKYVPDGLKDIKEKKLLADIDLKPIYAKEDSISDAEKVYEELTKTSEEGKVYTLVPGDNLWTIANKNDMNIKELLALNPNITEDTVLQIGQEINIKVEKPVVSVQVTEEYKKEELFIPEPIITEDADKYITYKKQVSPAKKGKKEVTINNIYVDGVLQESVNKDIVITEQGEGERIIVGTKKLPPKAATGKFSMPTSGRLTSGFGPRWGTMHNGIDIANSYGTPIYSSDGGTVKSAGWNGGYGNLIIIDHGNGFETYYGHTSKLLVKPGQKVAKGEKIALMGSTGNSTGSHVHFEIRKNGKAINPYNYL